MHQPSLEPILVYHKGSSHLCFSSFVSWMSCSKFLRCAEPLLNEIHCLLLADDTVIVSTDRELFIKKCNMMLKYFKDNSMSLNFPKSSYMIINPKEGDTKSDLHLEYGLIEYKAKYVYLGVVVTDMGSIRYDIDQYIESKRANVTIKYNNFLRKNFLAPLPVKLKVLGRLCEYNTHLWLRNMGHSLCQLHRSSLSSRT